MKLLRNLGMTLVALLGFASASLAATVSVIPDDQTIVGALGQSFEVTIAIDGLGDQSAPSLGAYDITLNYDASLLTYGGIVYDSSQMDLGAGSFTQTSTGAGSVNLIELSFDSIATLDSQQSDAFTLATLTFYTADYGTSALSFGTVVLSDAAAGALVTSTVPGSVTISAIPIPGVVLFPSALLGLAWVRRRLSR